MPSLLRAFFFFMTLLTASSPLSQAADEPVKPSVQPFWSAPRMENEPLLFVQQKGEATATARLLWKPTSDITITHPDLTMTYVAGADYNWKPGTNIVELTPWSRIPFKNADQLRFPTGTPNTHGDGIFFSEGHVFHDLQVQASYEHAPDWAAPLPRAKRERLPRSLSKLGAKQPLRLVVLGDSISAGYNASGFTKAPPFQPPYAGLVAQELQGRFESQVTLTNLSQAGTKASWGLTMMPQLKAAAPDLVILGFGMNHRESAVLYETEMRQLVAAVRGAAPDADIILVASMTANPLYRPAPLFVEYRDALNRLESSNIAVADVTAVWLELLRRKPFLDLTGNNINHPNDFGHRVYAQVILQLFGVFETDR